MSNETKREVFVRLAEDLKINDSFDEEYPKSQEYIEKKYKENIHNYDAALPDDLPVIPKAIGKYITSCKARMMDLHDSMFNWLRSEEEDEFMACYPEIFARAWLLGVWRVEETGEIVKLEVAE